MKKIQKKSVVWFTKYLAAFRRDAHQLIAWGYEDTRHKINSNRDEEEISGFLYDAIQTRLRLSDCPNWCNRYAVKNEDPFSSETRIGKHRKKTDIIIEEVATAGRPEFIFEAKCLNYRKSHHRKNNYIGQEGLQRFVRAEYAANYPEAGMLGYLQSDTLQIWTKSLKTDIEKNGSKLNLMPPQKDVNIVDAFPCEWVSKHTRGKQGTISIYHVLLECTTQNVK